MRRKRTITAPTITAQKASGRRTTGSDRVVSCSAESGVSKAGLARTVGPRRARS
jgi:hypothetical protein